MIDALAFAAAAAQLIALAAWISYRNWRRWDIRRRSDRLVHRNLQRMCGQ